MIDNEQIQQAVRATIAAKIIDTITPDVREAMFRDAIIRVLESTSCKYDLEQAIRGATCKIAADMVQEPAWQARLTHAVERGLDELLAVLPGAVAKMMVTGIAGRQKDNYGYAQPGALLTYLSEALTERMKQE